LRHPRGSAITTIAFQLRADAMSGTTPAWGGPFAAGSAAAEPVVGCVIGRAAGSQPTTTCHAPHALRRRRQIRPLRMARLTL